MKIGISITLGKKDKMKLDRMADVEEISRSEVVRALIRSKRVPKQINPSFAGLQEAI